MKEQIFFSIIVPSRGRPNRLKLFINSIIQTCYDQRNFEIIVGLDEDDNHNYDCINFKKNISTSIGPQNRTMGKITLDCIKKSNGKYLFLCNDDVIFCTKNWDITLKEILVSIPNKPILAYPNDGIKKESLCTFPIFEKKLLTDNPYFLPEDFRGSCIDLHIFDIFKGFRKGANIFYISQVICKHNHYSKYPHLFDDTYARRNRFGDDKLFISLSQTRREISYILSNKIERKPKIITKPNIISLLSGNSSFLWKIKIFSYMLLKTFYVRLFS